VIYQFSQIELFGIRPLPSALPPIVVHPEVHAAGELASHWRERLVAARGETPQRRAIMRAMLTARALRHRRDIHLARRVIVPSHVFASHISSDYRILRDRISVVPNPIDLNRFTPGTSVSANGSGGPVRVLFVSRLAVRTGVELVTELSHWLDDRAGEVRIEVIGNHSLWSDYRALMRDLNPAVATYKGESANGQLAEAYAGADLLIQPSHYESFALTVGEALACGVPVVASSEVAPRRASILAAAPCSRQATSTPSRRRCAAPSTACAAEAESRSRPSPAPRRSACSPPIAWPTASRRRSPPSRATPVRAE
jgi:glycosyltransferase involved in cell wall biosynthesis